MALPFSKSEHWAPAERLQVLVPEVNHCPVAGHCSANKEGLRQHLGILHWCLPPNLQALQQ